jgi:hypothetical protein
MKKLYTIFLCVALLFSTSSVYAQTTPECPACYNNTAGPVLKERKRDGTGPVEKVVTILLTGDWDEGCPGCSNPKILSALKKAVDRWNAADPSGPHIQLSSEHSVDVSVYITKKKLDEDTRAQIELNEKSWWYSPGPMDLQLREDSASLDEEDLIGVIAHEIGHGVKNLADNNGCLEGAPVPMPCSCLPSVMNQTQTLSGKRKPEWNTPSAADAASAEKWRTNAKNCSGKAEEKAKTKFVEAPNPEPLTQFQQPLYVPPPQYCIGYLDCTNWYTWNDGWRYIGTTCKIASFIPCPPGGDPLNSPPVQ